MIAPAPSAVVHRRADGAGAIITMRYLHHGRDNAGALGRSLQPFLIAHGPHDDARMVSVPLDHTGQVGQVGGGSPLEAMVAIGVAQMPVLVHHQHPSIVWRVLPTCRASTGSL